MTPFRVMSFNIRGALHDDGLHAWRNRSRVNVETIERWKPDLVGLQELQSANLETYRESLPGYSCLLGPESGKQVPYEANAILFDPGRLEVLDSGGFWLSKTPHKYSGAWGTRVIRSVNWARFRCLRTGFGFLHLNTHLDHLSALARLQGSKLILAKSAELARREEEGLPALVTGDFNSGPASFSHRVFSRAGFVDTYLAAGNEDHPGSFTYHAFFEGWRYRMLRYGRRAMGGRGAGRLDRILLADPRARVRVRSATIVRGRDEDSGIYPSDHYPVLAELATNT